MTSIRWWVFKIVLGGAKQLAGAKAKIKEILKYKKYGNMTLYKDLKRQELLEDEWFSTFFGNLYFHGKSKKKKKLLCNVCFIENIEMPEILNPHKSTISKIHD